jgi:hypothetical protein
MSTRGDGLAISFAWPDHEAALAPVLPVVLSAGETVKTAGPGEVVELPSGPVDVRVIVPGGEPLVARLPTKLGSRAVLPFRTEEVLAAVNQRSRSDPHPSLVAFSLAPWLPHTADSLAATGVNVVLQADGLRISSNEQESRTSAQAELVVASRSTPTRVVAVPQLGPNESAVIDLAAERPFGSRPALVPTDPRTSVLLAYIQAGEYELARVMASRVASTLARQHIIAWTQISFIQLLVGYAYAADEQRSALAAWCRRTDAVRLLGVDGKVLGAISAWHQGRPDEAARLLELAQSEGTPVIALGLEMAVRLAYEIFAQGIHTEGLDALATAYSVHSTDSDPFAATVTTPTSRERPVSLEGRGWLAHTRWALTFLAVRTRLPNVLRVASQAVEVVIAPSNAKKVHSYPSHTGVGMKFSMFNMLTLYLVVAWLGMVAVVVWAAVTGQGEWERLVVPLVILQAAAFTLLGVAINDRTGERAADIEDGLEMRLERSERRMRNVEEEAMKGRALAAALQAETGSEMSYDAMRHARMSRSLFGDLVHKDESVVNDVP